VIVGRMERIDIRASHIAFGLKVGAPPAKSSAALLHDEQVRRQPRPPAIAVRKGMNRNKPVMEAHCQFIGLVSLVFDPVTRVVNCLSKVRLYLKGFDAEIAFRSTVLSRPSPDLIEHAAMKAPQESLSEKIIAVG
jgi:hypothetical protein